MVETTCWMRRRRARPAMTWPAPRRSRGRARRTTTYPAVESTNRGGASYDLLVGSYVMYPRHPRGHRGQPGLRRQMPFLESRGATRTSTSTSLHRRPSSPSTTRLVKDVSIACFGQAASAAAVLLAAGANGKRFALPHARILLHQPWGGVDKASEHRAAGERNPAHARSVVDCWPRRHRPTPGEGRQGHRSRLHHDGQEAVTYGIIDEVIYGSLARRLEAIAA